MKKSQLRKIIKEEVSKIIEEGFFHEPGTGEPIQNEAHLRKEIKAWFEDRYDFNSKDIVRMWKSGKYNISTIDDALDVLGSLREKGLL